MEDPFQFWVAKELAELYVGAVVIGLAAALVLLLSLFGSLIDAVARWRR